MMMPLSPQNRRSIKNKLHRVDGIAADLNVLLIVIAIGLATLDMTFFLAEEVMDHLPPVTHMSYDAPASSSD